VTTSAASSGSSRQALCTRQVAAAAATALHLVAALRAGAGAGHVGGGVAHGERGEAGGEVEEHLLLDGGVRRGCVAGCSSIATRHRRRPSARHGLGSGNARSRAGVVRGGVKRRGPEGRSGLAAA
jgi:hypothetical protein